MARKSPNVLFEKITTVRDGWEDLARDETFGGMTAEEFSAGVARSVNIRNEITELENQLTAKMLERDATDAEIWEKAKFVVAGVAANPRFGKNSGLYEAMGYVPSDQRRFGLTRKKKGNGNPAS